MTYKNTFILKDDLHFNSQTLQNLYYYNLFQTQN